MLDVAGLTNTIVLLSSILTTASLAVSTTIRYLSSLYRRADSSCLRWVISSTTANKNGAASAMPVMRATLLRTQSRVPTQRHSCLQRSEEHTSELQSPDHLVSLLLLEKKKNTQYTTTTIKAAPH